MSITTQSRGTSIFKDILAYAGLVFVAAVTFIGIPFMLIDFGTGDDVDSPEHEYAVVSSDIFLADKTIRGTIVLSRDDRYRVLSTRLQFEQLGMPGSVLAAASTGNVWVCRVRSRYGRFTNIRAEDRLICRPRQTESPGMPPGSFLYAQMVLPIQPRRRTVIVGTRNGNGECQMQRIIIAFLACLCTSSAWGQYRITQDRGGEIGTYLRKFAVVRESGDRVMIDGDCLSACTLVLGTVPEDRICVTGRANFGFHSAWNWKVREGVYSRGGTPSRKRVYSLEGTQLLWATYPQHVRQWITARGGLTPKLIYLRGRTLARMYPSCGPI